MSGAALYQMPDTSSSPDLCQTEFDFSLPAQDTDMPLTSKGEEILASMQKEYGEKKGEAAFYASKNSGKITGVDARSDDTLPEHEKGDDKRFAKIEAHLAKLEQAAGILTDLSKDGQRLRQRIDALTAWS